MVQSFAGQVAFAVENFGDSQLARRFGVTRYPAFFVDDVLVATPKDFGFFGKGEGENVARYAPFQSKAAHARFRADLTRAIELVLAGDKVEARRLAPDSKRAGVANLPGFELTDLDGKTLRRDDLTNKVVLVDFWATWCPPCRGALPWLCGLRERFGDRLVVLALAVDSDEVMVRRIAAEHAGSARFALATPAVGSQFGDVSALPSLLVFDANGAAAGAFYGAPPTLHAQVEGRLGELLH